MDLETLSTMATVIGAIASLAVYMHRENHQTRRELKAELTSDLTLLEGRVNVKFDLVDARFEQIDGRFDRVEGRIERLDDRIYALALGMKPLIEQAQTKHP